MGSADACEGRMTKTVAIRFLGLDWGVNDLAAVDDFGFERARGWELWVSMQPASVKPAECTASVQ